MIILRDARNVFAGLTFSSRQVRVICSTAPVCRNFPSTSAECSKAKYVLAMFPYPSGRLHMGHLRVYTLSDVMARYYALKGHQVMHPIGWDAFGLPAENAAIDRGVDPAEWTFRNIEEMRAQLLRTGVKFNWERELFTCRPEYFRWTQWLFIQLYKHGLVRKAFSEVNWDPVDQTVLADEQVDSGGRSWRSGAVVEKRLLNQWTIEINKYAKKMLDGLESLEFEWREVADIQSEWIGPCDVYRFLLPVIHQQQDKGHWVEHLDLRIVDPTQLEAAQFVVLAKEHPIAKQAATRGELDCSQKSFVVLHSLFVNNFVTGRPLPFVVLLQQPAYVVQNTPFYLDARLGNADSDDGMDELIAREIGLHEPQRREKGKSVEEVLKLAKSLGLGGYQTSRTLKDWVVSRQRSWGTPIPMLLEEDINSSSMAPVPEEHLPVMGQQRGQRMLVSSFRSGWGRLETDTLDTYFDSSWYFLRFLDPDNHRAAFDPAIAHRQMPVDIYVGGVEHAKMHLFFARFVSHFLHTLGLLPGPEPFSHFIPLGIVRSLAFQLRQSGKYVPWAEVDGDKKLPNAPNLVHKRTGEQVVSKFEKMSKSKFNGVDPLEVIDQFGVDLTRLQLLVECRPNIAIDWPYPFPTFQIKNLRRWLDRVQSLVDIYTKQRQRAMMEKISSEQQQQVEQKLKTIYNRFVKSVSIYLEVLRYHNTALIRLQEMTNALHKELKAMTTAIDQNLAGHSTEFERCLHGLVVMMQLFAPEKANLLWEQLRRAPKLEWGHPSLCTWCQQNKPVEKQGWPELDQSDQIDILLVLFGTIFAKSAPLTEVSALDDAGLECYAREKCHQRFFQLLQEKGLEVRASGVERLSGGLGVVLNLKMADETHKRAVTAIIQQINMERRRKERQQQCERTEGDEEQEETSLKE